MALPIACSADDRDLDDAALWAVIDSAAASFSSRSTTTTTATPRPRTKPLTPIPFPLASPQPKLTIHPRKHHHNCNHHPDGEVVQNHRPHKISRTSNTTMPSVSETSPPQLLMVKHVQRSPVTPPSCITQSPERTNFAMTSYCSPDVSYKETGFRHSLTGQFPTPSLFKEYQNAAMAILEKSDYTVISGHPYIKKSGWRKISFYFNLSYEIKDKTIEFDESRNVQRAEFVVRAYMQGGRFSDGWGSCDRREKKFSKPNHDVPSTAETRAKNKACQGSSTFKNNSDITNLFVTSSPRNPTKRGAQVCAVLFENPIGFSRPGYLEQAHILTRSCPGHLHSGLNQLLNFGGALLKTKVSTNGTCS